MNARYVQPGDLVAGAYRLDAVVGQGRSGIVFAARDLRSGARVAIKFLRGELAHDQALASAFVALARLAAAVRCEGLCSVLEIAQSEAGEPCVVMEYLDGRTLARVLADGTRYAPRAAVSMIVQVCRALAAALELGMVHVDLRPSKLVMLAGGGEPRLTLLDLGGMTSVLAPQPIAADARRSYTAPIWLPAARYAAPEQLDDPSLADPRTNVWALGVILYELLCGRPAFGEPTPEDLLAAIGSAEPHALRRPDVELPEGLGQVIATALAKDPPARYASPAQLAAALEPYAARSFDVLRP